MTPHYLQACLQGLDQSATEIIACSIALEFYVHEQMNKIYKKTSIFR